MTLRNLSRKTASTFHRLRRGVVVAGTVGLGLGIALGIASGAGALVTNPITSHTGATPKFGNPNGTFPVPIAGAAVNTRVPNQVVGTGTPASCTSAAVVQAVAAGGIITFSCGSSPITIVMTATANVAKTEHLVVLDGGGLVTLSGGGSRRILFSDTCAGTWSTNNCVSQPYPQIVVQNMTFEAGFDSTPQPVPCTVNGPQCWYGGVNGGGAIYAEGGQFKAVNSDFYSNSCYSVGPDLGGGAIRVLAQYQNLPVYITGDTFTSNTCSNGGALSSINVNWDILNSVFSNDQAIGWGANPAQTGTSGGGSGGALYTDGENHNALIAGTTMTGNTAREGGGAIFDVVNSGWGTLTLNQSQLSLNHSGVFQNAPGIFNHADGVNVLPTMINSTDTK